VNTYEQCDRIFESGDRCGAKAKYAYEFGTIEEEGKQRAIQYCKKCSEYMDKLLAGKSPTHGSKD